MLATVLVPADWESGPKLGLPKESKFEDVCFRNVLLKTGFFNSVQLAGMGRRVFCSHSLLKYFLSQYIYFFLAFDV